MRILIALQEIAGYHGQVAEGLRERGHEVTFIRLIANEMGYQDGQRAGFAAAINWWGDFWFRVRTRSMVHKGIWWLGLHILRPVVFVWAVCRFRNFIFVFGRSLLPLNLDLPLLRLLGKKILNWFCIGNPVTAHSEGMEPPLKPGITALHSPSAPLAKGTPKILRF